MLARRANRKLDQTSAEFIGESVEDKPDCTRVGAFESATGERTAAGGLGRPRVDNLRAHEKAPTPPASQLVLTLETSGNGRATIPGYHVPFDCLAYAGDGAHDERVEAAI